MDNRSGLRTALLRKANFVANVAELNYILHNLQQCNSSFYCDLFKVLSGSDIVFYQHCSEQEKCQRLLQALQQFLTPHVKLDHIHYSRLAEQNEFDVKNLLDIFVILFQNGQKAAELSAKGFHTPARTHCRYSPLHQSTPHARTYSRVFSKPQQFFKCTEQSVAHDCQAESSSTSTTEPLLLKKLLNRYLEDVVLDSSSGGGFHCPPTSKPDILKQCEQHFPAIYSESATIKHLNMKAQHGELPFQAKVKSLPPSALKRIDNLQQRLELMMKVVQKDLLHVKCLHDHRNRMFYEQCIQKALHSKRLSDAKAQRYFRDYELQQKHKLQKPRTEEEQVLVKAVEKGLKAKKEEKRYAHKYAQEKLQHLISEHIEKIENRFRDNLSLPTAKRGKHKKFQVPHPLNLEVDLQKMEKDIKQLQLATHKDKDVVHFRELDASRINWRF